LALAVLITIFLLSFFILHCRTNVNRDAAMDIYDENESLLRTLNTYRMLFLLKLNTEAILKSDINTNLITIADNKEISDQHVNKLLDWLKKQVKIKILTGPMRLI
jgi:predicted nucleotidyltransferase component of viral defense system